ncbi:hypothetical protein D3C86_1608440 [compost metagenome]
MQYHVQSTQARVIADFGGQPVTIHFRHFGIGEDHQQLLGQILAGIGPALEHAQGLETIAGNMHPDPDLGQGFAQLSQGNGRVVHQ